MAIINLDKEFKPFGEGIAFEKFDFPSGCEPHIKFNFSLLAHQNVIVTCRISNSDDIIRLMLAMDALRRMHIKHIDLFVPYLPFARQDRVMVTGEPLSIKVMADIINLQKFDQVSIYDPHSEVCLALINNAEAISNHSFVASILKDKSDYMIVSPDAGAYKKIFKLCQHLSYADDIVLCNKIRNVETGQILNITCSENDFNGKDLYIIDDICDGGGTFLLLAQELKKRNCGKINLIVSHGIFSKGFKVFDDLIDNIYTTNSVATPEISNYLRPQERGMSKVKTIPLNTISLI